MESVNGGRFVYMTTYQSRRRIDFPTLLGSRSGVTRHTGDSPYFRPRTCWWSQVPGPRLVSRCPRRPQSTFFLSSIHPITCFRASWRQTSQAMACSSRAWPGNHPKPRHGRTSSKPRPSRKSEFATALPPSPPHHARLSMMIHYCKWESLLNIVEDTLLYLHL